MAYLMDTLDNSIKSTAQLKQMVGIQVLATINRFYTIHEIHMRALRRNITAACLVAFALVCFVISQMLVRY